jgi:hypothetical protein
MTHTHEFGYTDFWNKTTKCECGDSREATADELAYERELIAASERKQLEDVEAFRNELRDVHDALAS